MIGIYVKVNGELEHKIRQKMQTDSCKELIKDEQFEIYNDIGKVRASREKLLNGVEEGKINKVITYNLSRLSRNTAEVIEILQVLKNKNVELITVKEGNIKDKHVMAMLQALNELEEK